MSSEAGTRSAQQLANLTPAQKRALLEELLSKQAASGTTGHALSFAQQRLWFIDLLDPGQSAYAIPAALQLEGPLSPDTLRDCLTDIIERHEVLRTRFINRDNAEPRQLVDPVPDPELPLIDIPDATAVRAELAAIVAKPFDLATGPLLRTRLLRIDDAHHVLLLCIHHIVADYWSLRVLMREIASLYAARRAGRDADLPPLTIQYLDYAAWQRERQSELSGELHYWQSQLAGMPTLLQLPTDYPRPARQSFRGARHEFALAPELSTQLRELAREHQATLFATLLAALQALLFRHSGQDDFAIGTTATNRNREEVRDLIGLFVNNLVLRARPAAAMPFTELLAAAQQTTLHALANQELPFERVVETLDPERQLSHNALFQVMFVLHNTPVETLELPGLSIHSLPFQHSSARFDLSLDMVDDGAALHGFFEYSTDLFAATTIARLATHFAQLLGAIVARPTLSIGSIPLLSDDDKTRLAKWNATSVPVTAACVHRLIEQQASTQPDAIAVHSGGRELSYSALNNAANQLAHLLREKGAAPGASVALALPRGIDLLVSLLAVLKAGAHYVPLDTTHPAARLGRVLDDVGGGLLIHAGDNPVAGGEGWTMLDIVELRQHLRSLPTANLPNFATPRDLAYLIFTSGSTGRPKGVPIRHSSLVNLLESMARQPGMSANDRLLAVTTIAFDIATLEMLLPLLTGARVVIADEATIGDGGALAGLLADQAITTAQATPSTWRLLLEAGWSPPPGFKALCGGEALDPALARRLLDAGCMLWNLYGPTETTIWSGALQLTREVLADNVVPIGNPIANTGLYVLEPSGLPAPPGVAGELYISGMGLSPGYHQRDALTAERFIETTGADGEPLRLYRTGDRVSRRGDGLLVFRGRFDQQIKLRGYRIELGEIESLLTEHPAVNAAVVVVDQQAEQRLVAYCARDEAITVDAASLRSQLAARLPAYMVPAVIMLLESLPLTPNGKLDHKALPPPGFDEASLRPLTSAVEKQLAGIWSALLGTTVEDAAANFFSVGGHSLLAARMAARISADLDIEFPVRLVFEHPRLVDLAASITGLRDRRKARQSSAIAPRRSDAALTLSAAQHRQWVLAGLEPENPYYNVPAAVRLHQPLDPKTLETALAQLVARHDVLHTAYLTDAGKPAVELRSPLTPTISYRRMAGADEAKVTACLREFARQPFDLAEPPLLRVLVVDTGDQQPVVMLVLHHIAGDAWSLQLLFEELVLLYGLAREGRAATLPAPSLQYLDYVAWAAAQDTTASLQYWQQQLATIPPLLDLPTDFPRPAAQGFNAGERRFRLPAHVCHSLEQIGSKHGATLFMTLLSAFSALLHRFSSADDIVIGCPTGHRPHPDLEKVVGLFVNTLAIRTRPHGGQSFTRLLTEIRDTVLTGFSHQDAPFEQVVSALDLPRSWGHAPVFQVMFLWQTETGSGGITTQRGYEALPLPVTTTKVDLTLAMSKTTDGGLLGRFEFRDDLFHPATMATLADGFVVMLEGLGQSPATALSALPLLSREQAAAMAAWNETTVPCPAQTLLHERFEQLAAQAPETTALVAAEGRLSYRQLNVQANGLAQALIERGVGPDSRVAICLPRTARLITAILAVLKAGGAYVPLDPDYPRERIEFILGDADVAALITDTATLAGLGLDHHRTLCVDKLVATTAQNPARRAAADNLAYIIYTSGSTGVPKGVAIEHHSPVTLIHWAEQEYPTERLAGVLAATSVCFDLSVFEIFVPLSTGGSVILADNALALTDLAAREQVTLVNTVPTAAAELVRRGGIPSSVTTFNVAGEPLSSALVRDLYGSASIDRVYNLYGPSEDTTYSTGVLLSADEPGAFSPIGRPIANTRAYVLDDHMQQVAPGFPGELYLAGDGVARGYWNRPALTAERFLPNLHRGEGAGQPEPMMYATGDRVRLRHDNELAFLGRLDHQVKLRGFRIELGEIEAVLETHPDVRQAVTQVWSDTATGSGQLLAYLLLRRDSAATVTAGEVPAASSQAETWRHFVAGKLPAYMVPNRFIIVEKMPLLPNGKVARRQLPVPAETAQPGGFELPMNAVENRLAEHWRAVLQQESIGRHDNFFSLGGDSILALQLVSLARSDKLPLTPGDIFQFPTIASLASLLESRDELVTETVAVTGDVALTPVQHWFFEQPLQHAAHWNQGILLEVDRDIDPAQLETALLKLAAQHDMLRSTFHQRDGHWLRNVAEPVQSVPLQIISAQANELESVIQHTARALQGEFTLDRGPLWAVAWFSAGNGDTTSRRLLVLCHHLLVDGVSWRVLISDLQQLLLQLKRNGSAVLPPPSSPASAWVAYLGKRSIDKEQLVFWQALATNHAAALPVDHDQGSNLMRDSRTVTRTLDTDSTRQLLQDLPDAYRVDLDELLLTALAQTLAGWTGEASLRVELEGHGRPDLDTRIDLSRTLGWLTTLYPVDITIDTEDVDAALRQVKSTLRRIPHRGLDFGVYRYLQRSLSNHTPAAVRFNYFGQTDQLFPADAWFSPARESIGALRHPDDPRGVVFDINALVNHGRLTLHWSYSREQYDDGTIKTLAEAWQQQIITMLTHCLGSSHAGGYVDADFPQMDFAPGELDDLLGKLD